MHCASKLGRLKPARFASLQAFERIIANVFPDPEILAMVQQSGATMDIGH